MGGIRIWLGWGSSLGKGPFRIQTNRGCRFLSLRQNTGAENGNGSSSSSSSSSYSSPPTSFPRAPRFHLLSGSQIIQQMLNPEGMSGALAVSAFAQLSKASFLRSSLADVQKIVDLLVPVVGSLAPIQLSTLLVANTRIRGLNCEQLTAAIMASLRTRVGRTALPIRPRYISNILTSMKKLGARDEAVVDRLLRDAEAQISDFSSQELSATLNVMGNFKLQKKEDIELFGVLLTEVNRKVDQLNPQALVNVLNAMIVFGHCDQELCISLLSEAAKTSALFSAADIVQTLRAAAILKLYDEQACNHLFESAKEKAAHFSPRQLALLLNAAANLPWYSACERDSPLLALWRATSQKARLFRAQDVALTLNAMAKLQHYDEVTYQKLLLQVRKVSPEMTAQGIAITMNAMAKINRPDLAVVSAVLFCALQKVNDFKPQELATTLNAIAKFGSPEPYILTALSDAALNNAALFKPNELVSTLLSLARLRNCKEENFGDLLVPLEPMVRGFQRPQSIVNTLTAMALVGHTEPQLTQLLLDQANRLAQSFTPQDIANTLRAMAKLRLDNEILVRSLLKNVRCNLNLFTAREVVTTLISMAMLSHRDAEVASMLLTKVQCRADSFHPESITAILRSMVKLGCCNCNKEVVLALISELRAKTEGLSPTGIAWSLKAMVECERFHDRQLCVRLMSEIKSRVPQFRRREAEMVLSSLFKLGFSESAAFQQLRKQLEIRTHPRWGEGI